MSARREVMEGGADEGVVAGLAEHVAGLRTSVDEADRVAYSRDLWPRHLPAIRDGRHAGTRPAGVVWPESTEALARLIGWCAREGVPVVPFGAGSGVCGGVLPDARTVVVDLKRMRRWRSLDREAPSLEIEAGAMGITLEEDLQRKGFTIGHFPSSILCSTVGGWIAARGAGQCSGRYGKIEDMVVGLELVDGRGEVRTLRRRRSDVDLLPLVIGSEGIFGTIASATFRLHAAPTARAFAAFSFRSTEAGWEAMRAMFQAGVRPAVARLYDPFDAAIARRGSVKHEAKDPGASKVGEIGAGGRALRAILRVPGALNGLVEALEGALPGELFGAMLVLVFEGSGEETSAQADAARSLCLGAGGEDLGEGPAQRWLLHRYSVSYRQPPTVRTGAFLDTMEVAAPWSKLAALYRDVRHALGKHVFVMAHLSHAYPDGCSIYFTFAGVPRAGESSEDAYDRTWRAAIEAAVAAGGTLSHHHGVGRSKAPLLGRELGSGVEVVRALGRAFDPHAIMNRGNLLPESNAPAIALPRRDGEATVDFESLLVDAPASMTMGALERLARSFGATTAVAREHAARTLGEWIATGCAGGHDPLVDPVDHAIAGLTATLASGTRLRVAAGPRRAVGPDLTALVTGAHGRWLALERADVRIHRLEERSELARTAEARIDRDPPMHPSERAICEAIDGAIGVQAR